MKKMIIAMAVMLSAGNVYAGGIQVGDNLTNRSTNTNSNVNLNAVSNRVGVHNSVNNSVKNVNFIDNSNRNSQGQLQGQKQGQFQSAYSDQSQSANNNGNHQNISFKDERQAPAIGGPASGPCTGFSGGLSVIGGAVNFASVDSQCDKREAARIAHMIGRPDIAHKVLMSLDAVKAVMEDQQAKIESRADDKSAKMTAEELAWFNEL